MYARSPLRRTIGVFVFLLPSVLSISALAQTAPESGEPPQHAAPDQPAAQEASHQHDMHHMSHDMSDSTGVRQGSGTAWLPDETPMNAIHAEAHGWMLMTHASAFLEHLDDEGPRGSSQTGSINWLMGVADRPIGKGHLRLRGMITLEPWTIRGCGYPDLLATGEVCGGDIIHDRQHPHDLFMEMSAEYDRPIGGTIHVQVYGGPVGEPALGPVAFPHRPSAMSNPLAPITHHWFDATHLSYGVLTGGVYSGRWKAEGSVFNGREPDEDRTNIEIGPLDSWSGRLWFLPGKRWALQVSGGHLKEAEAGSAGAARTDIDRLTASATYHRAFEPGSLWASTIGWGRNSESGGQRTNALLAETSLSFGERHTWFGRFEISEKPAHDLDVEAIDSFTVAKLQGGYTRYFGAWHGLRAGAGATASIGVIPDALENVYGRRFNAGLGVFLTIRTTDRREE
jgi:hypothetical protein